MPRDNSAGKKVARAAADMTKKLVKAGEIAKESVASVEPSKDPANTPQTVATRAGETGHNLRYVLLFGMIGVIVGFAVVWFLPQ